MSYILMVKVLGGEWQRHRVNDSDYETDDLYEAMGQKATILDPIREVMIVRIQATQLTGSDYRLVRKTYELVE